MESRVTCEGKVGKELEACLLKIENMAARAGEMDDEQKAEFKKGLEALRNKREEVWNKYQEMKGADEDAWKTHHENVQNSMMALQEAMDKSYSRFTP